MSPVLQSKSRDLSIINQMWFAVNFMHAGEDNLSVQGYVCPF